jgi:hypothetical protein
MATDFLIDGMLSGTGVRDARAGGYVKPLELGLPASLADDLATWQRRYEEAHFAGFPEEVVDELDGEGLALASRVQDELSGKSVGYFSNGRMKRLS